MVLISVDAHKFTIKLGLEIGGTDNLQSNNIKQRREVPR